MIHQIHILLVLALLSSGAWAKRAPINAGARLIRGSSRVGVPPMRSGGHDVKVLPRSSSYVGTQVTPQAPIATEVPKTNFLELFRPNVRSPSTPARSRYFPDFLTQGPPASIFPDPPPPIKQGQLPEMPKVEPAPPSQGGGPGGGGPPPGGGGGGGDENPAVDPNGGPPMFEPDGEEPDGPEGPMPPRRRDPGEGNLSQDRPRVNPNAHGGMQNGGNPNGGRPIDPMTDGPWGGNRNIASEPDASALPQSHPDISNVPTELASTIGKCVACHKNETLPPALKTVQGLTAHLGQMNDKTLEDMMGRANLHADEKHALKGYVDRARQRALWAQAPPSEGAAPACYMSAADQALKTRSMPEISSGTSALANQLAAMKSGEQLTFYDRGGVPRTWQESGIGGRMGGLLSSEHAVNSFMYKKMGYHSDGGREYPWAITAGLDASFNGSSEKFFWRGQSGGLARTFMRDRRTDPGYFGDSINVNGPIQGWEYETGTTFGETLKVRDPATDEMIPFEIRLRTKDQTGAWIMDVLRPFANPGELAAGLKRVCDGSSNAPPGCDKIDKAFIDRIANPTVSNVSRRKYINAKAFGTKIDPLALSTTAKKGTQEFAALDAIPDMPPDVVRALLTTTPFKSVFNQPWVTNGNMKGWAPTTDSNFSIVPKNYFAAYIPMTQQGCMNCHDTAGRHVDNFTPDSYTQMHRPDPNDANRARTWYNMIPGEDHVLSFHPFSNEAVKNGAAARATSFNKCLTQHGLLRSVRHH